MKPILAKSNNFENYIKAETLVEHTKRLIKVLDKIKDGLNLDNNFKYMLRLICLLHDLGKINIKMQQKLELASEIDKQKRENNQELFKKLHRQYNSIKDMRHNILSVAFLKEIFQRLNVTEETVNILSKAIMLHHGSYEKYIALAASEIEESIYKDIKEPIMLGCYQYNLKEVEQFLGNELGIVVNLTDWPLDYDCTNKLNEHFRDEETKLLYILYKGFLNLIDHIASSQIEDFNYFNGFTPEQIDEMLRNQITEKANRFNKINKITKNDVKFTELQVSTRNNSNENILTIAFTGAGKTVADYRYSNSRKFFLVPTKISAESFYNDSIFGEEDLGILHGDISLYVNSEESNVSITLKDKILARNFCKNYIIATVDQLLLSMFKYPNYEKVFAAIYRASITVDEVHLLDPRMFLVLTYFMQFAYEKLDTRFHLMTATLPAAYKEKLKAINVPFLESNKEEKFAQDKKVKVFLNKKDEEIEGIISKAFKANKKVLVIKNTIESSINLYQTLSKEFKGYSINILHSRFKFEDKTKKYRQILDMEGDIWISTQAVEIALDLDFPVIISDLAPMDSLIQRMGRCNRHNSCSDFGEFYILNSKKDVYDSDGGKDLKPETEKTLKKKKEQVLSMEDRKRLLEDYFSNKKVQSYFEKQFQEAQESICRIFGFSESANFTGTDLILSYDVYKNLVDNKQEASKLFRDTDMNVKVILRSDYEEILKDRNQKSDYRLIQKKSITITVGFYWYLKKKGAIETKSGCFIVDDGYINYGEEGLTLNKKVVRVFLE